MKLLYFVTEDWYFWSHRLPLAQEAVRRGWEVHLITRRGTPSLAIEDEGIIVHPLDIDRSGLSLLADARTLARLVRLYRTIRPDLCHHVAMKPVLYGTLAANLAGRATVVNALAGLGYIFSSPSLRAKALRPLVRTALRLSLRTSRSLTIVQNGDDVRELARLGKSVQEGIRLIRGSGVDIDAFKDMHAEREAANRPEPVVGLPARLNWDKGVAEFYRAAKSIKEASRQTLAKTSPRFVLIGKPDETNPNSVPLETLRGWVAEGVVEWWGHQEDMPSALGGIDVACLPSTYGEGLPKSLLEAAATGLPIVTTDSPGCRDAIVNEQTGILVPPGDHWQLVEALKRLCGDGELRRRMGRAGRELVVDSFALDTIVSQTFSVYHSLTKPSEATTVEGVGGPWVERA